MIRKRNKLSDETKKKISEKMKGKKLSIEHKEKLKIAQTGKKQSEATRQKKRVANLGKIQTAETKEKIKNSLLKYWQNVIWFDEKENNKINDNLKDE